MRPGFAGSALQQVQDLGVGFETWIVASTARSAADSKSQAASPVLNPEACCRKSAENCLLHNSAFTCCLGSFQFAVEDSEGPLSLQQSRGLSDLCSHEIAKQTAQRCET